MRKSLWVFLVVAAVVLSACGPAMPPSTSPKTQSGEIFMLALPRLDIAFDKAGNPTMLGMKLSDVGAMMGQDFSYVRLDPFYVSWMTNANIQHIEMRQTGDGLALLVNGKPMPHIAWNDDSLNRALDLAALFAPGSEALFNVIRKFLPVISRLGLDVVVRFPLQPGAKEVTLADPSVAMAKVNPTKDPASIVLKFEVRYDAQGVPAILGISGYDLAAMGLPVPVAIDPSVLKNLQDKNVQLLELRTKPEGMFIYLNGSELPSLAWDKQLLKSAAEVYAQMNPGSPAIPFVNQIAPVLDTLDIGVMTRLPLAPGATQIPGEMH